MGISPELPRQIKGSVGNGISQSTVDNPSEGSIKAIVHSSEYSLGKAAIAMVYLIQRRRPCREP